MIRSTQPQSSGEAGALHIEDDADVVWATKRDGDRLTLELTKMKDGPDGTTVHLTAQRTLTSLTLTGASGPEQINTTETQVKILDTVRDLFPDGVAGNELRTTAALAKTTFYRALRELIEAGHLTNTGTRKSPFYELPALTTDEPSTPQPTPEDDYIDPDQEALA